MLDVSLDLRAWSYNPAGERLHLGGKMGTCEPNDAAVCVRFDVGGVRFYMDPARLVAAAQVLYIAATPPQVHHVELPPRNV